MPQIGVTRTDQDKRAVRHQKQSFGGQNQPARLVPPAPPLCTLTPADNGSQRDPSAGHNTHARPCEAEHIDARRKPDEPRNRHQTQDFDEAIATIRHPAERALEQHKARQPNHLKDQQPPQPWQRGGSDRTEEFGPFGTVAIRGPLHIREVQGGHHGTGADGGQFVDFFENDALGNNRFGLGLGVGVVLFENQDPWMIVDTKRFFGPDRRRYFEPKQPRSSAELGDQREPQRPICQRFVVVDECRIAHHQAPCRVVDTVAAHDDVIDLVDLIQHPQLVGVAVAVPFVLFVFAIYRERIALELICRTTIQPQRQAIVPRFGTDARPRRDIGVDPARRSHATVFFGVHA